jgi:hypothetical protein
MKDMEKIKKQLEELESNQSLDELTKRILKKFILNCHYGFENPYDDEQKTLDN